MGDLFVYRPFFGPLDPFWPLLLIKPRTSTFRMNVLLYDSLLESHCNRNSDLQHCTVFRKAYILSASGFHKFLYSIIESFKKIVKLLSLFLISCVFTKKTLANFCDMEISLVALPCHFIGLFLLLHVHWYQVNMEGWTTLAQTCSK